MTHERYCYRFRPSMESEEVEGTLMLALLAVESLHGSQVRLDADYAWSTDRRACTIDASTPVGKDLCKLFTGFLDQEFGSAEFEVKRLGTPTTAREREEVPA